MSAAEEFQELFGEWGTDGSGAPLPCTIRVKTGSGSRGPIFAEPAERPGLPQFPQSRLVRNPDGNEITSSTRIYLSIEDAGLAVLGSRVTLADGREQTMAQVAPADAHGLFSFVAVDLA